MIWGLLVPEDYQVLKEIELAGRKIK